MITKNVSPKPNKEVAKNHNMTNVTILDLHTKPVDGFIPCMLYNKNINKRVYINPKIVGEKDHIYQYRIYVAHVTDDKDLLSSNTYISVKEVQAHPVSGKILHVDLFLIEPNDSSLRLKLPLRFVGKEQSIDFKRGSYASSYLKNIEVSTSYTDLVPEIIFNVSEVKSETSVRSSAIVAPKGVKILRQDLNLLTLTPAAKGE